MNDAYESEDVKPLDFSLGYHWRSGNQNWMLYVRSAEETTEEVAEEVNE